MNIDTYLEKLDPIKQFFTKHIVVIFIFLVVSLFAVITVMISKYANLEPTSSQVDEKTSSITSVRLDEKSIQKIQSLQDQNINIESLFDNGRDNPFQ